MRLKSSTMHRHMNHLLLPHTQQGLTTVKSSELKVDESRRSSESFFCILSACTRERNGRS